jgi:hypothetical protein
MAALLAYHGPTYELLGREPAPWPDFVRHIDRGERRAGRALPASVREWYALAEGVSLLDRQYGRRARSLRGVLRDLRASARPGSPGRLGSVLSALDRPLRPFSRVVLGARVPLRGQPGMPLLTPGRLLFLREYGDIDEWDCTQDSDTYACLDGSDDPPVVEVSEDRVALVARSFSSFVFHHVWRDVAWADNTLGLGATVVSGPVELDFLRDHFSEGPILHHERRTTYPFFGPGIWVQVSGPGELTAEVPCEWEVRGLRPAHLERAVERLLPIGVFAQEGWSGWRGEGAVLRSVLDRARLA